MSEELSVMGYLYVGEGATVHTFPRDIITDPSVKAKLKTPITVDMPNVRTGVYSGYHVYFWHHDPENRHQATLVRKDDPYIRVVGPLI